MENNYIIQDGTKYIAADKHEAMLRELDELKKKCDSILSENAQLRTKSEIDPLTKLYRRGAAIERVNHFLKGGIKACALIVFDLDNFKHINDTFGHVYGNTVIKNSASVILDEVGENGIAARFGGDEFFAFLPSCSEADAIKIANNIIEKISAFDSDPHTDDSLSCSAGISTGQGEITYRELFIMADKALYSSKHNGKSQVQLYNHENMSDIEAAAITYTSEPEAEKKPYSDVISRAIEMASRAGTTEDAIYALFSHIAMNFGIISATILSVDISKDMITVNYGYKLNQESSEEVRRKNNVGYYFHQDLITLREMLCDRTVLHLPQTELDKLSNKLSKEIRDDGEIAHRLFYAHMQDNGNYSIGSLIVPGPVKYWGEDELKAIAEISSIIMVYADKARYISKHEESLQERLDTDKLTGAYSMGKFYETSGLIRKLAVENSLNCYLISAKIKNLREFNRTYSMTDGDSVLRNYYNSLDASPYKQNGITAHDSSKFITIMRTTDDIVTVKQVLMDMASKFIDSYKQTHPNCPLKIAIGTVAVYQDDILAVKLDEAYYDRTLVE